MPLWTPLPPPYGGRLCIIRPPPSIPCVFYPCRHVLSLVCMTNMSPLNLCWIKDLLWGEKRKRKIWLNNWYFTWENGWMNFRQIIGCLQNRFFLFEYSCLENPMDRGALWATVHRGAKNQKRLSTHAHRLNHRQDVLELLTVFIKIRSFSNFIWGCKIQCP